MRLVLDIARTRGGRYEGRLTVPGTGGQQDFAGILELLGILEEQLGHGGCESGAGPDGITDDGSLPESGSS